MQLSENTINILKNFSGISQGMLFKPGKTQSIIEKYSSVYAEAILDEEFPVQFGVTALGAFINDITLFKNPEITFNDNVAVIGNDDFNVAFRASNAKLIVQPPENIRELLNTEDPDASFTLSADALQKIVKVSSMNGLPFISIVGKGNRVYLRTHNKANDTSNTGTLNMGENLAGDFEADFKTEHFDKLLLQDYDVELKLSGIAKFTSKDKKLTYFVAIQV